MNNKFFEVIDGDLLEIHCANCGDVARYTSRAIAEEINRDKADHDCSQVVQSRLMAFSGSGNQAA